MGAGLALATGPASAAALRHCDDPPAASAVQQDRLLQVAALLKDELSASGERLALVARSGSDLSRFGLRYSHAGISLAANPNAPWSVRQLYYACDERRPRLFDQGLPGFVLGTGNPELGFLSLLLLPPDAAAPLERQALDPAQALALLGTDYSANAHAFSTRYQNCNQWLAELLALAWGDLTPADPSPRERAQRWLREQGYEPTAVAVGSPLLMLAGILLPWLHRDDHPVADLEAGVFHVSLPRSIEAFVRARWPSARRVEVCHAGPRVVIRRGWTPIGDTCEPETGDEVRNFQAAARRADTRRP